MLYHRHVMTSSVNLLYLARYHQLIVVRTSTFLFSLNPDGFRSSIRTQIGWVATKESKAFGSDSLGSRQRKSDHTKLTCVVGYARSADFFSAKRMRHCSHAAMTGLMPVELRYSYLTLLERNFLSVITKSYSRFFGLFNDIDSCND